MERCTLTFPSAEAFNRIVLAARKGEISPANSTLHPAFGSSDGRYQGLGWEFSRLPNGAQTDDDRYSLAVWAGFKLQTFTPEVLPDDPDLWHGGCAPEGFRARCGLPSYSDNPTTTPTKED